MAPALSPSVSSSFANPMLPIPLQTGEESFARTALNGALRSQVSGNRANDASKNGCAVE